MYLLSRDASRAFFENTCKNCFRYDYCYCQDNSIDLFKIISKDFCRFFFCDLNINSSWDLFFKNSKWKHCRNLWRDSSKVFLGIYIRMLNDISLRFFPDISAVIVPQAYLWDPPEISTGIPVEIFPEVSTRTLGMYQEHRNICWIPPENLPGISLRIPL